MSIRVIESDLPYYCDLCGMHKGKGANQGHRLKIEYHTVSDIVTFIEDGEPIGAMDYCKAKKWAKLINEI